MSLLTENTTAKNNISAYKAGDPVNILNAVKYILFANCED